MAERELKKMNRSELIEIIYAQQKQEHELRDKIKQLEEKLTEKNIILEKSGSIAEASLRLNKIFEDAQAAADQYVESVRAKDRASDVEENAESIVDSTLDVDKNSVGTVGNALNTEEKTPDNNELIVKMEEEIPVVNPEKITVGVNVL